MNYPLSLFICTDLDENGASQINRDSPPHWDRHRGKFARKFPDRNSDDKRTGPKSSERESGQFDLASDLALTEQKSWVSPALTLVPK